MYTMHFFSCKIYGGTRKAIQAVSFQCIDYPELPGVFILQMVISSPPSSLSLPQSSSSDDSLVVINTSPYQPPPDTASPSTDAVTTQVSQSISSEPRSQPISMATDSIPPSSSLEESMVVEQQTIPRQPSPDNSKVCVTWNSR